MAVKSKKVIKIADRKLKSANNPVLNHTLEELLKEYPGLKFDSAALLNNAHNLLRKKAA